jgi:hypothetical protein
VACLCVQIAAGNGEQVLSRDVRRLAHNMDFTRLLSWYHTGEWKYTLRVMRHNMATTEPSVTSVCHVHGKHPVLHLTPHEYKTS